MQEPLNRKERRAKAKAGDSQAQGVGPLGLLQRDNIIEALRYAVGVHEQFMRVHGLSEADAGPDTFQQAHAELERRMSKMRNALKRVGFEDEQLDP